jgi:TolB protein
VLLLALAAALGQFEAHSDLGSPAAVGVATYNGATQEYTLRPGGAPHFAWKRVKGDFVLQASVSFLEQEPGPQANAGLVVRTGTGAGSSFAGVVLRNDKTAAIQYRILEGGLNDQSEATLTTGDVIQLERRGAVYYFSAARAGVPLYTRQRADLPMGEELYVGLAASAPTVFSNVRLAQVAQPSFALELVNPADGSRHVVYRSQQAFEAPMWTPDGSALTFTTSARLVRFDLFTRQASALNVDISTRNDGWSPDGRFRVFTRDRDLFRDDSQGLIRELRLTTTKNLEDAADYAPDGSGIYFHSDRSGRMQIWSMGTEGQNPQPVTNDGLDNWYPHVSPDGKTLVMLSLSSDPAAPAYLRLMPIEGGGAPKVIAYVHGGVSGAAWSPDGRVLAFVSRADGP